METAELDRLQDEYRAAVDVWVRTIREEEALASNAEHGEAEIDAWELAHDAEEKARKHAKHAKSAYEDALRRKFFNF